MYLVHIPDVQSFFFFAFLFTERTVFQEVFGIDDLYTSSFTVQAGNATFGFSPSEDSAAQVQSVTVVVVARVSSLHLTSIK